MKADYLFLNLILALILFILHAIAGDINLVLAWLSAACGWGIAYMGNYSAD